MHRAGHVFESRSRTGRIPLIAHLTPWLPKVCQYRKKKLDYFSPHSLHNTEAGGVPDVDLGGGSIASARDFLLQDFSLTTRSKYRLLFSCPSFFTQDNRFLEISPTRPSVFDKFGTDARSISRTLENIKDPEQVEKAVQTENVEKFIERNRQLKN